MDPNLNQRLTAVREQVRQIEQIEAQLAAARTAASDKRERLVFLEARLAKENRDVRRYESMSLVALLHHFLGDAEQRADRERQEAAAAALKCAECRAALGQIDEEIAALDRQRRQLGDPRLAWRVLLDNKEAALREAGDDNARRLLDLSTSIGEAQSDLRELTEALGSGQAARALVEAARDQLEAARGWGTFDMLGGGLMTTAIKHAKIDQARKQVQQAQAALARFARELADVKERLDADGAFEMGGLLTFADYFFDGLIVDWMVQARIDKSLAAVTDLREKLDVLLQRIERRRDAARRALERLHEDKTRLVETA